MEPQESFPGTGEPDSDLKAQFYELVRENIGIFDHNNTRVILGQFGEGFTCAELRDLVIPPSGEPFYYFTAYEMYADGKISKIVYAAPKSEIDGEKINTPVPESTAKQVDPSEANSDSARGDALVEDLLSRLGEDKLDGLMKMLKVAVATHDEEAVHGLHEVTAAEFQEVIEYIQTAITEGIKTIS